MIEHFPKLLLLTILFTECNSREPQTDKNKPPENFGTTEMSAQERNKLIEGAQHNDKFILGSWQLIAADSSKILIPKQGLATSPLQRIDFFNDFSFKFYPTRKIVDSGTYEWMADYREIVLTTHFGTDRMLVKKVDSTSLITKKGDIRWMFKRRKNLHN